jgi:hypothetical protein
MWFPASPVVAMIRTVPPARAATLIKRSSKGTQLLMTQSYQRDKTGVNPGGRQPADQKLTVTVTPRRWSPERIECAAVPAIR